MDQPQVEVLCRILLTRDLVYVEVAYIILWRNKSLSVANILGFMTIWFLLEVLEYPYVSVVFYVVILCILMIFITMIVMSALLSFYGTSTEVTN
ncbi:hypothetical protein Hanom_Chr16g01433361 [Helianthus anomalus]